MNYIIGISGKIKCGKDTIANIIFDLLPSNLVIDRFSAPVKKLASELLDVDVRRFEDHSFKELKISELYPNEKWIKLVSDSIFVNKQIKALTIRDLLVGIGDGLRESVCDDIWVNIMERRIKYNTTYIIPDLRYENEARWVLSKPNSLLIRVNRPGVKQLNYKSETGLDNFKEFHYTINNNAGLKDLEGKIKHILKLEKMIN